MNRFKSVGYSAPHWFAIKGDDRTISTRNGPVTTHMTFTLLDISTDLLAMMMGPEFVLALSFSQLYKPGWIWQ